MITVIQSISNLKQLFLEIFLNKTDKVSDISDNSVVNATAYGVSKVAQKCMKDIAIVESHIFPDSAYGTYLDASATLFGAPARGGALASSTYLRIIGSPGTTYVSNTNIFKSVSGIQFNLDSDITIDSFGYGYAKVRSLDTGAKTNVDPNTISSVNPQPTGHIGVTNEYIAIGGQDAEDDELFRRRIKKHLNVLAKNTLEYYTEIFRLFNPNVLRLLNLGVNEAGQRQIGIVTQNGIDLSSGELTDLLDFTTPYFGFSDINQFGGAISILLVNAGWTNVDVQFRVQITSNYDANEVRKSIQVNLSKALDFRYWVNFQNIQWTDLLQVIKATDGVKFVPDEFFFPQADIEVVLNTFPRIRGFIMKDLDNNIIADSSGVLTPVFYQYI